MHRFTVLLALLVVAGGAAMAQDAEPYDEWAESPTVRIGARSYSTARVLIGAVPAEGPAFIWRDRAFLPAREVLTRLGGGVEWVKEEQAFYATYPQMEVTLRLEVGQPVAGVYRFDPAAPHLAGELVRRVALPYAPFLEEGRVFSPLRGVVGALGGTLLYYPQNHTVYVTPPARVGLPAPDVVVE